MTTDLPKSQAHCPDIAVLFLQFIVPGHLIDALDEAILDDAIDLSLDRVERQIDGEFFWVGEFYKTRAHECIDMSTPEHHALQQHAKTLCTIWIVWSA